MKSCILWAVTALIGFSCGQFPDAEYCSVPCSRGRHTMCKYRLIGPNCQDVKSLMNENGRMKILSLHNSFRNALASGELKTVPTSSNMRQVYWDLELEAIAERWALQCNASYNDECRNVNRFSVGQIMSKSNIISPSVNYYEALLTKLWFPEVENLQQGIVANYRQEREVKHIAQILSANTMRIGCADVLYSTIQDPKPVRVTICNYGPVITNNEPIYRIGKPCTECPHKTECRGDFGKYPHLCSELRHFDVVEPEKTYDVVQREYDDEEIDNVEVDSNVFRKGKADYFNNRRKHVKFPQQWNGSPNHVHRGSSNALSDYVVGGKGLEEEANKGNSSSDYEGEEVGMADDPPTTEKPKDKKVSEARQGTVTNMPTGVSPTTGGSSLQPATLLYYLTGQVTIVLTTIGLRN